MIGLRCPSDIAQWTITLIISNEDMKDTIKILKSLEKCDLLMTTESESK